MEKIIYRKNAFVISKEQVEALLTAMDDFIGKPEIGKAQPRLDLDLMTIWNKGKHLAWEWSEETESNWIRRKAREQEEKNRLDGFRSDNKAWKDAVIRPWRNLKLAEWIDDTFAKPLLYNLTPKQEAKRIKKRRELLDWPARPELESYKSDEELDALRPVAPDWSANKPGYIFTDHGADIAG